jgi:hypothetical protein
MGDTVGGSHPFGADNVMVKEIARSMSRRYVPVGAGAFELLVTADFGHEPVAVTVPWGARLISEINGQE